MTEPMSGAQFARQVGTDPEKWAEAFDRESGRLSAETGGHWPHNREERIEFLARWFRDAMGAAVKAEHDWRLQALASMNVVHQEIDPLTPMENTTLKDTLAGLRLALAAQERGDDQAVLEILRLKAKQLGIVTSD